jgi:hypothetical protein
VEIMGTHRIGHMAFDPDELRLQNDAILKMTMHRIADGVGEYTLTHLWYGAASDKCDASREVREQAAYLDRQIESTFRSEHIALVRVFAARHGGYIRPHRDFTGSDPWTRFHIPLQTNEGCLTSQDEVVYRMGVGEIWFFDGSRPHSGICFSKEVRLHLIIDFAPGFQAPELFRDPKRCQPVPLHEHIPRPRLTEDQLAAIYRLSEIATKNNFMSLADVLGTIHFEKQVSCAAMYDWLVEIGRRSSDPGLIEYGEKLKEIYLRPT